MSDKPSGLFSRWTQRRQQVEEERLAEEAAIATEQEASADEVLLEQESEQALDQEADGEAKVLTAEDLPDPDKIEIGGSFASFMGTNVDPTAKAAALKALWKQPQYNEIDGLLEYALDYSNQPKLSAEQSAEIAKKIFRHVTKKEDEELELAQEAKDNADESSSASLSNDTILESEAPEDILDIESDDLTQNAPDFDGETKKAVI